jgi:hypothetical protein
MICYNTFMPTKEAQAVINAAIPVAMHYALLKKHIQENNPLMILSGNGEVEVHHTEGMDISEELETLLRASADFLESVGGSKHVFKDELQ